MGRRRRACRTQGSRNFLGLGLGFRTFWVEVLGLELRTYVELYRGFLYNMGLYHKASGLLGLRLGHARAWGLGSLEYWVVS